MLLRETGLPLNLMVVRAVYNFLMVMIMMVGIRSRKYPNRGLSFFDIRSFSFLYFSCIFLKSGPAREDLPSNLLGYHFFMYFALGDNVPIVDGVCYIISSSLGFTRDFLFQNHPT